MGNPLNTTTVNGITYDSEKYATQQDQKQNKLKNNLGKDAFLQLLVTQMRYQDPLDPQDNGEYLAQLAQFSSLEQMTNVAEGLTKVSTLVGNIDTSVLVGQLSSMIGHDVEWTKSTTLTDQEGNAILDKNGNAQTIKDTFQGKVAGVTINDGVPTVVAVADGKHYSVKISDITRIGEGMDSKA